MTWKIEWDNRARKELRTLDASVQNKIFNYLDDRVINNPRNFGRGLVGDKAGLWRYRIGDYRVVCQLEDDQLIVLIVSVGHRKEIYD